jgi:hypothetical protein
MARGMRGIGTVLLIAAFAAVLAGCKSPPPRTDSTKGTTQHDRDTGMHDNHM